MRATIVIGKNFGDEGKGMVTDYFAGLAKESNKSCIVIRFNGGAQAGHTVDNICGRFVFHEISSGTFKGADTFWSKDFLPDLYKLPEELKDLSEVTDYIPKLYASPKCRAVNIDDVLVNMAVETIRGENRHGSCGMGIYEAVVRSKEHPLFLGDIKGMSAEKLYAVLKELRAEYYPKRFEELGVSADELKNKSNEFSELLCSDAVIRNASEGLLRGAELVELKDETFIGEYEEAVFEGAQGLLLDEDNMEFAPHTTASHTGAAAAVKICREIGIKEIEAVYVSRSYVTRHGAGRLPAEDAWRKYDFNFVDATNIENPWQGQIRFAPHESMSRFTEAVIADISGLGYPVKSSLFITHLNETGNKILFADGIDTDIDKFVTDAVILRLFEGIYVSDSKYSGNTVCKR